MDSHTELQAALVKLPENNVLRKSVEAWLKRYSRKIHNIIQPNA